MNIETNNKDLDWVEFSIIIPVSLSVCTASLLCSCFPVVVCPPRPTPSPQLVSLSQCLLVKTTTREIVNKSLSYYPWLGPQTPDMLFFSVLQSQGSQGSQGSIFRGHGGRGDILYLLITRLTSDDRMTPGGC